MIILLLFVLGLGLAAYFYASKIFGSLKEKGYLEKVKTITKTVTQTVKDKLPSTKTITQDAPSVAQTLGNVAITAAAPVAPQVVGNVVQNVGSFVKSGTINTIAPAAETIQSFDTTFPGKLRDKVGSALLDTGAGISAFPIAGIFAGAALTGGKFRGQSDEAQAAIFGQAATKTLATALATVPIIGQLASVGVTLGAGTYEGKRAVKATGVAIEQGYNAQKQILTGDVSKGVSTLFGDSKPKYTAEQLRAQAYRNADLSTRAKLTDAQVFAAIKKDTADYNAKEKVYQAQVAATKAYVPPRIESVSDAYGKQLEAQRIARIQKEQATGVDAYGRKVKQFSKPASFGF